MLFLSVSQHRNVHAKSSSTIAWHGMKMKKYFYNLQEIRQEIVKNLNGPGCSGGYRSHWHELMLKGIRVPRKVVEELCRKPDPVGCQHS